ncbi:unnamed protein product [Brassica oleracea var. botrytis]
MTTLCSYCIIWLQGEPSQDGSVPPKADSDMEVLDEKVSKQILKEGHDSKPSKYLTMHMLVALRIHGKNSNLLKWF